MEIVTCILGNAAIFTVSIIVLCREKFLENFISLSVDLIIVGLFLKDLCTIYRFS